MFMKNLILSLLSSSNAQLFGGNSRMGWLRLPSVHEDQMQTNGYKNDRITPPARVNPFLNKNYNTGSEDADVHMKMFDDIAEETESYQGSFFDDFLSPNNDALFQELEDNNEIIISEASDGDTNELITAQPQDRCLETPPFLEDRKPWRVKFYYDQNTNSCKWFKYNDGGKWVKGGNKFPSKRKCEIVCVTIIAKTLTEEPDQSQELIQNKPGVLGRFDLPEIESNDAAIDDPSRIIPVGPGVLGRLDLPNGNSDNSGVDPAVISKTFTDDSGNEDAVSMGGLFSDNAFGLNTGSEDDTSQQNNNHSTESEDNIVSEADFSLFSDNIFDQDKFTDDEFYQNSANNLFSDEESSSSSQPETDEPKFPYTGKQSCNEPKADAGFCRGFFMHYTYDKVTNSCVDFVWGGCHGTMAFMMTGKEPIEGEDFFNNFPTKLECEQMCVI